MATGGNSRIWQYELASAFIAAVLAGVFYYGHSMTKSALLFVAVFLMLQPFIIYDHFAAKK